MTIAAPMPGDPIDPDWASDVTDAVNDLQGGALKIVAGQVTITATTARTNALGSFYIGSFAVTFPAGTFVSAPSVQATANSGVPGDVVDVTVNPVSASGCTINLARVDNTTATIIYWIATAQT